MPNLQTAESSVEEEDLLGLLLAHTRPDNAMSAFFAAIIAGTAMSHDHLWLAVGLYDWSELSHLLGAHVPTLAAGNTNSMRWKKYLYRKLCEADGHISMGCTKLPTAHGAPDLLRTRRRRKTCKKPVGERSPSLLPVNGRRERFGTYKEERQ
ncbi:nitrogen fixation protein NifQ [Neorhizobium galegae]